ncbi:MAG: hypothetical protein HY399_07535 [Elusimicrobia bacterium]|nr:hypothetical protein [Elusimicrobiota bacterium]
MNTQRLNITIPKKDAARLKAKSNKSAFIAEAVREKLDLEEKNLKEQELAQAYREVSREEAGLLKDWDSVSGDSL